MKYIISSRDGIYNLLCDINKKKISGFSIEKDSLIINLDKISDLWKTMKKYHIYHGNKFPSLHRQFLLAGFKCNGHKTLKSQDGVIMRYKICNQKIPDASLELIDSQLLKMMIKYHKSTTIGFLNKRKVARKKKNNEFLNAANALIMLQKK